LHWFELWRELSLSTKGNQPIPHELVDQTISWSRSQEPVFFILFRFSVDWLQIGRWPLRGSSPTALWSCSPCFVVVGEDFGANREIEVRGDFGALLFSSASRFADSPLFYSWTVRRSGSPSPEPSFLVVLFVV
jgi:hypothetical protein